MSDTETAFQVAIEENPDNDPARLGLQRTEAISLYKKKWNPQRRILNVNFLEEPGYIDKVIRLSREWEPHMGMRFAFGSSDPDILVSFVTGGSWSRIGTDSRHFASIGQPTINFGWFDDNTSEDQLRRTTLHEFGHALSLVHEQSHPDQNIEWNKPKVYAYYALQGWDEDMVDRQVFQKYALQQLNGSQYDPLSIMHYPVPTDFVFDPADAVGWNSDLSDLDKRVIERLYPRQAGIPAP